MKTLFTKFYLKLGAASFHNSKNSFYWKCCQEVKTITCTIPDLQKMNLEKKKLLPVNQIKTIEKNALLHDLKQIPKVLFIGSVAKK